jgi:hypothetical protein
MRILTTTLPAAALALALAGCGSNDIKAKIDPSTMPASARLYVPGMT